MSFATRKVVETEALQTYSSRITEFHWKNIEVFGNVVIIVAKTGIES